MRSLPAGSSCKEHRTPPDAPADAAVRSLIQDAALVARQPIFNSALRVVGRRTGVDVSGSTVTAYVGIGPEGDAFDLVVTLESDLPNVPPEQAREIVDAAHQVCPYSRATRGNISVELRLTGPAAAAAQPA